MKYYFSICWCIFCLTACKVSSADGDLIIIPVDVKQNSPVRLSEISDGITKIELETSEECLIGHIVQVLCVDDRIFVLDAQGGSCIYVFDLSGKFLFDINNKGQGPGEFLYIRNITADIAKKHLYVASMGNKILIYDYDGNFIDENTKVSNPEYIRFENDLLHVFLYEPGRRTDNNTFINTTVMVRYYNEWQPIDTIVVKSVELNNLVGTALPNIDFISQDNLNNLFIYYPVMLNEQFARDTLYMLDQNQLKPYAKLRFSDENTSQQNKRLFSITHTSHLIIAEYLSITDKGKKYFCYDLNNKSGKNMTGGFLDDVYDTGLAEIRFLNNDYFYFIKEVEEFSDFEPNPVVYLGKFKK